MSVLQILESVLATYSTGIQSSLKRGHTAVYISEDLFTVGRPILQNLLTFKVNVKPNGSETITKDQDSVLTELDLNPSKVNQKNTLNLWKILAHMLSIF